MSKWPYDDIGSWLHSSDGAVLAVFGGREAPLSEVRRWTISGQHLELRDEAGRLRARLEGVYLK